MSRLQIRLFGPYFSSLLVHSYGYEPANELKSVLKHPNFRFGPYSPTVCQGLLSGARGWKLAKSLEPPKSLDPGSQPRILDLGQGFIS